MADSAKGRKSRSKERSRSRNAAKNKKSKRVSPSSSSSSSDCTSSKRKTSCSKDKRRKSRRYSSGPSSGSSSSSSESSPARRKENVQKSAKSIEKRNSERASSCDRRKKNGGKRSRSRSRSDKKNDDRRHKSRGDKKPGNSYEKVDLSERDGQRLGREEPMARRNSRENRNRRNSGEFGRIKEREDRASRDSKLDNARWSRDSMSRNRSEQEALKFATFDLSEPAAGKHSEEIKVVDEKIAASRSESLSENLLAIGNVKKLNKRSLSNSSRSSSSSSSSGEESRARKERRKRKKLAKKLKKAEKKRRKKEKKLKKKLKKSKLKASAVIKEKIPDIVAVVERRSNSADRLLKDIPLEVIERAKAMAPMTKEQWEKKQSVVRRVYDEETGRHRLIKGDGEVLEEIVSRERHKEINKQATRGDGEFFQSQLRLAK